MPVRKCFKELVSERLLRDLRDAMAGQDESRAGNTVLVVDPFTLTVVNSCISYTDQLSAGFFTVAPFETAKELARGLRRRQYDTLDALYFMRNTRKNLERLQKDFEDAEEAPVPDLWERLFPCVFSGLADAAPDPPMYASARVLFLPGSQQREGVLNWELAHQFLNTSVEQGGRRLARLGQLWRHSERGAQETPVEFSMLDRNAFSLELPDTVSTIYQHAPPHGAGRRRVCGH
jgi:hypothetical protein